MDPNSYIHEQLMHEYVQERQREIEQRQLLAHLQQPRHRMMWHPIAGLRIFFVAFGASMKQHAQREMPSV